MYTIWEKGIVWCTTDLDDGSVLVEPVSYMAKPTTDGSKRSLVLTRKSFEVFFEEGS